MSEWLTYCALDLSACEVPWPLEKLDRLSDLRIQTKETRNPCVSWHIFKNERTVRLRSLESMLTSLDAASCTDAWRLKDPVRLLDSESLDWKIQVLERRAQDPTLERTNH